MPKHFYQCDVAESDTQSIWTGSLQYTETIEEAEFNTMLELQQDWGDEYMPERFIEDFGAADSPKDPEFPGVEAWNAGGYWYDAFGGGVTAGMLTVKPIEALAQLGKIECDLPHKLVERVMAGKAKLAVGEIA